METRLTVKQEKFCVNYFTCGNATEAAVKAGYSPKTAHSIATENLQKPAISERLKELQEKVASAKIMSVTERKEVLSEIARGRLKDFCECGEDGVWFNIGQETLKSAALKSVTSKTIVGKEGADDALFIHAELHNPIEAIKELNKMDHVYEVGETNIGNLTVNIITAIPRPQYPELAGNDGH